MRSNNYLVTHLLINHVTRKDADNNVEIENVKEQINGKTCEKSEDPDKITPGGSRNKIEQSADDIAGRSFEYLPNEQEKVINEENRFSFVLCTLSMLVLIFIWNGRDYS